MASDIFPNLAAFWVLTHSDWDSVGDILQTTFSSSFRPFKIMEFWYSVTIFVMKSLIDNNPTLVPIMAWHRTGAKQFSDSVMTHSNNVARPMWLNEQVTLRFSGMERIHYSKMRYLPQRQRGYLFLVALLQCSSCLPYWKVIWALWPTDVGRSRSCDKCLIWHLNETVALVLFCVAKDEFIKAIDSVPYFCYFS